MGNRALVDFGGNVLLGDLRSRTALRLLREWIDLHVDELNDTWVLARAGGGPGAGNMAPKEMAYFSNEGAPSYHDPRLRSPR